MKRKQSVIIRSKTDPSQQMQCAIDYEKGQIGFVMNNGLEMLFIDSAVGKDLQLQEVPSDCTSVVCEYPDCGKGSHDVN